MAKGELTRADKSRPFVLWLTGLSGSGKSTIARKVYDNIAKDGRRVERLDGDVMREVFPSTGFSKTDRDEHIKRVGYMASRLENHGVIVIASFISPYKEARRFVRNLCANFVEVYVSTSLAECERRDSKGLYAKARAGEIRNFTGIDDPYEPPDEPEIVVDTESESLDESVSKIVNYIGKCL